MDFKSYLEINARGIDDELDEILSGFLQDVKKTNIKLLPFALGLLNSTRGGKRIRGVLVKLGYEIGDGGVNADILKIGSALEILHSGFLIHDDIIDQSEERRGQPSLYEALGGDHYGISQAITIGDIGLYLPVKIITDSNFLGEDKLKVLNHLSQMVVNTGWGQIMDVEGLFKQSLKANHENYIFTIAYKTAKYTIAGPMQIGAMLAGADEKLIKALGEFGENAGIAFQIKDDILDGEGREVENNKRIAEYVALASKVIPDITEDQTMIKLLEDLTKYLIERTK